MASEQSEEFGTPSAYPTGAPFPQLLDWHLNFGTRPLGRPDRAGTRWTVKEFAAATRSRTGDSLSAEKVVRNWRTGRNRPNSLAGIEFALFGDNERYQRWRIDLRSAYARASQPRHEHQGLTVIDNKFVRKVGWSDIEFINKIISLDYQITDDLTEENEAPPAQMARAFMDYPDTWRGVVDKELTLLGYWHFTPLPDEQYEMARTGRLTDNFLIPRNIRQFRLPGDYNIYIAFIGTLPTAHARTALRMLILSFLDVLRLLSKDGIYIGMVCANALSGDGDDFCRSVGMRDIGQHTKSGVMFENSLLSIVTYIASRHPTLLSSHLDVLKSYETFFDEGREPPSSMAHKLLRF